MKRRDVLIGWRPTSATSLGASFGFWLRRCGYVPLRCRCNVLLRNCGEIPLRRLSEVPPRRSWVFHLRLVWGIVGTTNGTSLSRTLGTLSRRSLMVSWRHATETSRRHYTETSLGFSFVKYLRRRWDGPKYVATTSSRSPLAGWVS